MQESPSSTTYGVVLQDNTRPSNEPYKTIQVSLIDEGNLWSQFSKLGTEMIITKSGRKMFPGIKLRIENLNPYTFYKVYMEIAPVDNVRYKYNKHNWVQRGTESPVASSWVEHRHSPAEGFKWMLNHVDFNDVKLTNCLENVDERTFLLRSMYKYMIVIHVEEGRDITQKNPLLRRTFPLVTTTFTAVTTYQNPQVKDLKTDTNIHAKGIRQKRLKFMHSFYSDVKENFSETSKKPRIDFLTSSPSQKTESLSPSSVPIFGGASSGSAVQPLWDDLYRKIPDFANRNDSLHPSIFPQYHRIQDSSISSASIPLTTPLTVHCPSPCLQFERQPYYNSFLPLHPHRLSFYPYQPSHRVYPESWSMYPNNAISSNFHCNSENFASTTFNICSTCRDDFNKCVRCEILGNTEAPSSSTADAEVTSSFQIHPLTSSSSIAPEFRSSSLATESTLPSSSDENSSNISRTINDISSSIDAESISSSGSPLKLESPLEFA